MGLTLFNEHHYIHTLYVILPIPSYSGSTLTSYDIHISLDTRTGTQQNPTGQGMTTHSVFQFHTGFYVCVCIPEGNRHMYNNTSLNNKPDLMRKYMYLYVQSST